MLKIDESVFSNSLPLVYTVQHTKTASVYILNPLNVKVTPEDIAHYCPPIELQIDYGITQAPENFSFSFSKASNQLTIATTDKGKTIA